MVRYMWLKTQDIHSEGIPLFKLEIIQEINAQGLESILDHIMHSEYVMFAMQYNNGIVIEVGRLGENFVHRKRGLDWEIIDKIIIRNKLEKYIKMGCNI